MQKNPQLYDFSLRIVLKAQCAIRGPFLVVDTQLYIRGLTCSLVREHESKSGKTSVFDAFCTFMWAVGFRWGLDAPAHNDILWV